MKKEKYIPKSDFKMDFISMVEALENTGYIVDVTREVDNQKRLVCIPFFIDIQHIPILAVQEMLFHDVFTNIPRQFCESTQQVIWKWWVDVYFFR